MTFKEEKLKEFTEQAAHHQGYHSTWNTDFLSQALAEQKARILEVLWSERGSFEQMEVLDRLDLKITNL